MLTVYRRHLEVAKSGHPEELRTSEFDERKKGWKRCECPIFASGTLNRISRRQNTGQWEWEPAKLIAVKLEAFGRWDGPKPEPPLIINHSVATTNRTTAPKVFSEGHPVINIDDLGDSESILRNKVYLRETGQRLNPARYGSTRGGLERMARSLPESPNRGCDASRTSAPYEGDRAQSATRSRSVNRCHISEQDVIRQTGVTSKS
jgi:hypothetical protein